MWKQLFTDGHPPIAAVNAILLLLMVAVVVIPYLIYTNKSESETR